MGHLYLHPNTTRIRSLTPQPTAATSQVKPQGLFPSLKAIAGVRPRPPRAQRATAHRRAPRKVPGVARAARGSQQIWSALPAAAGTLDPHTFLSRRQSPSASASANQSPHRLWANPRREPKEEAESASLGAGSRARASLAAPARRADILVGLRRSRWACCCSVLVGGAKGANPARFGDLTGGHTS